MPQISRANFGTLMTRLFGLNRSPALSSLTAQQRTQLHTLIGQNADDQAFFIALGVHNNVSALPAASVDVPPALDISEQAQQLGREVISPVAAASTDRVDAANGNSAVATGNSSSSPPAASGDVPVASAPYILEQAQQLGSEVSAASAALSSGCVDSANGNSADVTGNSSTSPPAASEDVPVAAAPHISEQARQLDGEVSAPSPSAVSSPGRVDAANGNSADVTGNSSSAPPAASGQNHAALERFKLNLARRNVPPEVPQSTKKQRVVHIAPPRLPHNIPLARQHYQIHLGHGLPNPIFNQVYT